MKASTPQMLSRIPQVGGLRKGLLLKAFSPWLAHMGRSNCLGRAKPVVSPLPLLLLSINYYLLFPIPYSSAPILFQPSPPGAPPTFPASNEKHCWLLTGWAGGLREIPKSPGFGWWSSEKRDETNEKKRETENGGQGEGKGRKRRKKKEREEDMRSISISHVFTLHFKIEKTLN